MDIKWKKSRAVCGLLAFVVGLSLILEGLLFFGASLSSRSGRQWMVDSFQEDWRNTQAFRDFVSSRLETLITMGAGGNVYGSGYYDGSYGNPLYMAQKLHEQWEQDKNVLYYVSADGKVKYTNDENLANIMPQTRLDSYGFFLRFNGEEVSIWLDGEKVDVYGDGWYNHDQGGQWYVPGYQNFTLDEEASKVKITMAVINQPQIFIQGNYGTGNTEQYNELYHLTQNLKEFRQDVLTHITRLGCGAALLVLYVLLRRDKARADQFLARGTGRLWFEVKVVLFVALAVLLIPRFDYFSNIWQELVYAYADVPATAGSVAVDPEAAEMFSDGITYVDTGTAVSILTENGSWLFREYLSTLARYPGQLLAIFWGFYLLIVNDWRYNKKPWRHGLFALLIGLEMKDPIQKRLTRTVLMAPLALAGLLVALLPIVLRGGVGLLLGEYQVWHSYAVLFAACTILAALYIARGVQRGLRTARDLGAVSDFISTIRAGGVDETLDIPPEHELHQMADDLNHIQQGLHQAVEERTHSERMKVELVTNVSHDLKTPLTSIISYTELLAQEPLEPPASEYVKILGEKSQRLRAMVQDVFEVSKAASGQLPVNLERLDYARLLRQTLADMDGAIRDSGLALRVSIPEEEVPITADSDRLYRVFQNLLGNALKYSLPGSRIYLSLEVEGEQASARLRNTSATELKPGADYTARFVRGDESRTDGGSGLGLSIADSFTRACGGALSVATEADLFSVSVTFPLFREEG